MADIQRNLVTAREKARLRVLREAKEAEARSKGRFHFLGLKQAAAAEAEKCLGQLDRLADAAPDDKAWANRTRAAMLLAKGRPGDRVYAEIRYEDDSGPQLYLMTQDEIGLFVVIGACAALLAGVLPARRAARVSPVSAMADVG